MNSSPIVLSRSPRVAAFMIAAMVLSIMAALFHHPVVSHHGDVRDLHIQTAQLASADQWVHGALMAMLIVLASALTVFNRVLGARRTALSGAFFAYCLGCVLLGVAMLFDGFVVPDLAGQFGVGRPLEAEVGLFILSAIGVVIQVFSKAGLIAHCTAMLIWTCATVTIRPTLPVLRWLSAIGLVSSLLPASLILFAGLHLTPHSLMAIFAVHSAWYITVAWLLYRSSLEALAG